MDAPVYPGCLITCRLLGVIEAEQTERDGKTERNDRLIAVSSITKTYQEVNSIHDLPKGLLDQIEHYFASYNDFAGKDFKPLGRKGAEIARKLVRAAASQKR